MFVPSKYQKAVFDFFNAAGSAIIQAVAGSGKTTTIVKFLDLISETAKVLFLAFNSGIAKELDARTPKHVKGRTFNSVGHGALWLYLGKKNLNVESNKVAKMLRQNLTPSDFSLYGSFVSKLVGLAKNAGIGYLIPDSTDSWFGLIDHFDLSLDSADADVNRAISLAQETLQKSNQEGKNGWIDFDDQLYLPLIWNLRFAQNDWVFVDESQDTNMVQQALLKRMLKPTGRLIVVGDKRQAIYGFRGADSSAMDRLREDFGAVELPLSICYRCAKAIVRAAQKYVPEIEYAEDAPEGIERSMEFYDHKTFGQGDAIICRNTAPLVEMAYRLIANGVGCKVLGRKIGDGLVSLVKKMKAKGINNLLTKLGEYKDRECARHVSQGHEEKAGAVQDKFDCLTVIISNLDENNRTIPALITRIEVMFSDELGKNVTLCTAHKSKGLEFTRVFILDAARYMPSKWARKAWQKEQENHLIYVAITRAMLELYWITSEDFGRSDDKGKGSKGKTEEDTSKGQGGHPSAKEGLAEEKFDPNYTGVMDTQEAHLQTSYCGLSEEIE